MVFYNTIYTLITVILHVICHLSEKVPLGMVCGIVKNKFTANADGETNKGPLIHSKVKTAGCVSPRTWPKGRHYISMREDTFLRGNPAYVMKGNPPNRSKMTLLSDNTKAELNHCFIIHSN